MNGDQGGRGREGAQPSKVSPNLCSSTATAVPLVTEGDLVRSLRGPRMKRDLS